MRLEGFLLKYQFLVLHSHILSSIVIGLQNIKYMHGSLIPLFPSLCSCLQVMFSHNRPNISTEVGIPDSKNVRLLLVVRNPLLHIASIYFESVCRYGLHIKGKFGLEHVTNNQS